MTAAPPIAFVACLVFALTWFSFRAVNPEAELFDHALADLDHFAMIGNALHRDVFAARVGTLRNYDPLVREVEVLRASLQRLRETAAIDAETTAVIDQLAASIDRQEELVELFKSENALLQNSLAFLGRFTASSAAPNLDPAVSAAAAAILRLTLDTSAGAARDVQERLDALEQQARQRGQEQAVEGLLAHGRLLQRLLPSVDSTLKAMRALPQKQDRDALRTLILEDQLASRMSARRYRALLYGTSLLLVSSLVFFGVRLKSRARALHRRAAIEHMIASISMRFINAPLQAIDAEVDRALAEMAGLCGADRAYFVMLGPVQRVHLWHKEGMEPPPGWPARALDLAVRLGGADGVIHVPCVRRMPIGEARSICLELGLGGWACATNADADGVRVVLGFDVVGRPCRVARRSELGLMRMALDTIVQAVGRHTMEKERTRLEARLQQARRMERIGMFTSGIAHNFNNILGGILGHSEVMEERVGPDAKLLRNLGAIRRGAERARDLIDQILVLGRSRAVCRKPLSVGALIAETASLLEVARPPAVELVIRQPPAATLVSGEHAQLQQVLLNLCGNATNAMPDGGRIEVATGFDEISETRTLSHGEIGPGLRGGSSQARPSAARQFAGLGGRVGRRVLALTDLYDLDETRGLAARGLEYLAGLLFGHGARRVPWLALRQVDELGDVPADEVVLLRSPDRPDQRALDLHQTGLAEHLGDVPEEPVGVGGLEVLELRPADLRIDPLLSLAAIRGQRVRIEFERVEPVGDALPDCVGGRRLDAGFDLLVQPVELVLDFGLGLAAHSTP